MENNELIHHSKKWDRTGMVISVLCLMHCFAFPFLIASLPALDALFGNSIFEIVLLSFAIIVGSISFFTSYKKHRKIQPMLMGVLGVSFLAASLYHGLYSGHDHPHHLSKDFLDHLNPLMIIGGLLLISGHIWNIHACHCFCDKSCSHEEHKSHSH